MCTPRRDSCAFDGSCVAGCGCIGGEEHKIPNSCASPKPLNLAVHDLSGVYVMAAIKEAHLKHLFKLGQQFSFSLILGSSFQPRKKGGQAC